MLTSMKSFGAPWRILATTSRLCRRQVHEQSGKSHPRIEEPIKFAESMASTWKAEYSRIGYQPDIEKPWYEGIVISLSTAVFLAYFCIYREENDVDQELSKSLYDRIAGLEEAQLRSALKYNQENALDTKAIEARLNEIEQEKK